MRRRGSEPIEQSRSASGSVTIRKAPTGTMRRRNQPSGPVCEVPLASSTWRGHEACPWASRSRGRRRRRVAGPSSACARGSRRHAARPLPPARGRSARHACRRSCDRSARRNSAPIPTSPASSARRTIARVGIDIRGQQFLGARQLVVVLGLGRELELADAREVAVDLLFRHEALDRVDAGVEGPVEPVRRRPCRAWPTSCRSPGRSRCCTCRRCGRTRRARSSRLRAARPARPSWRARARPKSRSGRRRSPRRRRCPAPVLRRRSSNGSDVSSQ